MTKENEYKTYFTYYNREAIVTHQGKEYQFTEKDFKELNRYLNYWHNRTDPSTWLCAATVKHAILKFSSKLPRAKLIDLCAQTLNISKQKLEGALDWNANYLAFHDGGTVEEYHVYPPEEE